MSRIAADNAELACLKEYIWTEPRLAVLVRGRNEIRALPEFWRRLSRQTVAPACEWVFLDCESNDGSLEFLLGLPVRVYSLAPEKFSFGRSCNQLMALSTAPVACFLSAHVFLEKECALEEAMQAVSGHEYAAAYLRQVPNPILGYSLYEKAQLTRRYPKLDGAQSMLNPEGFSNAASILTRKAWQRHPFPDLHGSEDFVWAETHLRDGGSLYYLPEITAMHSHNESAEELYARVALNVRARGGVRSIARGTMYLVGVFAALMRTGAKPHEAWSYALAHARAYWTAGRETRPQTLKEKSQ